MNQTQPIEFVSVAEIARVANRSTDTLGRAVKRLGILPDGSISAGRGAMPIFRADRVTEILAALGPTFPRQRTGLGLVGPRALV